VNRLESHRFLPAEWRRLAALGPIYMFNPAITIFNHRTLIAYRVVLADQKRRIAITALGSDNLPLPNTTIPLSDYLLETGDWHADPRFCCMGDRLFIHFNNGGNAHNDIFLLELDPQTLRPKGPARPLQLEGHRQRIEKNWMLFSPTDDTMLAIYRISPHIVLHVDLSTTTAVKCTPLHNTPWTLPQTTPGFHDPRGGTPPVRIDDTWFSFFHVLQPASLLRRYRHRLRYRRGRSLHSYQVGFYGFSARPPFQPICYTPAPICIVPARSATALPALNRDAERVLYPAGARFDDGQWTLSAGLHDEHAVLLALDHASLLKAACPIALPNT
jgi:hypothetical protein